MNYTLEQKKMYLENSRKYNGSILDYCKINNLAPATFYKWKKEAEDTGFIDITNNVKKTDLSQCLTLSLNNVYNIYI